MDDGMVGEELVERSGRIDRAPVRVQDGRAAPFFSFHGLDGLGQPVEVGPGVAPSVREPEPHDLPVERVEVQRQLVIGSLRVEGRHVRDQDLRRPRRAPTVADQVLEGEGLASGLVPPVMLRLAQNPRVFPASVDVSWGIADPVFPLQVGRQPPVPVGLMPRGLLLDVLHVPHPLDVPFGGVGPSPFPFVVPAAVHGHLAAEQRDGVTPRQPL